MRATIICISGAVVGVIIAMLCVRLALPIVLRRVAQQFRAHQRRLPIPMFNDEERLRTLIITIYRYVVPLMFAAVGAVGAYHVFIADAP